HQRMVDENPTDPIRSAPMSAPPSLGFDVSPLQNAQTPAAESLSMGLFDGDPPADDSEDEFAAAVDKFAEAVETRLRAREHRAQSEVRRGAHDARAEAAQTPDAGNGA